MQNRTIQGMVLVQMFCAAFWPCGESTVIPFTRQAHKRANRQNDVSGRRATAA